MENEIKELKQFTVGLKISPYNYKLRMARKRYGMTPKEFSELVGVSYNTYISYENMTHIPKYDIAMKISEILGIPTEELFPDLLKKMDKKKLKSIEMTRQVLYSKEGLESIIDLNEAKEAIYKCLDTLDKREKRVLELRFFDGKTMEEVGDTFNVSRERVAQIESMALRKLRHPSRSLQLKQFL